MATNITDLRFDDGAQINVVRVDEGYTWVTTKLDLQEHGVMLEDGSHRIFLPWHFINRIYQGL